MVQRQFNFFLRDKLFCKIPSSPWTPLTTAFSKNVWSKDGKYLFLSHLVQNMFIKPFSTIVLILVENGFVKAKWRHDVKVCKKYGLLYNLGFFEAKQESSASDICTDDSQIQYAKVQKKGGIKNSKNPIVVSAWINAASLRVPEGWALVFMKC